MSGAPRLQTLRRQIAVLERGRARGHGVSPFGDPQIDGCLAGGGLARGAWHALTGDGLEGEMAAAPGAFAILLARPLLRHGVAVWVLRRDDLYAPGLAALGFPAQRLIFVRAGDDDAVLAALEDSARTSGVAVAVGETDAISLVAGRRLQLACEVHGATVLLIERRPYGGRGVQVEAASPATRWRIASAPGAHDPAGPGLLGPPRWRAVLERSRGGRPGAWIVEMKEQEDGPYPLRVVAELADHRMAAPDAVAAFG
jgi:protein ImuA